MSVDLLLGLEWRISLQGRKAAVSGCLQDLCGLILNAFIETSSPEVLLLLSCRRSSVHLSIFESSSSITERRFSKFGIVEIWKLAIEFMGGCKLRCRSQSRTESRDRD